MPKDEKYYMQGRKMFTNVQCRARMHIFLDAFAEGFPNSADVDGMLLPDVLPWPGEVLAVAHAIFHGTAVSFTPSEALCDWLRFLLDARGNLVFPRDHWLWDHLTPDLSRAAEDEPPTA